MHVGDLMRANSSLFFGNFVGIAVAHTAFRRPGGAAPVPESGSELEIARQRVTQYCTYLVSSGHMDEARWVGTQMDAAQQVRDISARRFDTSDGKQNGFPPAPWLWLMGLWAVASIVLCNAIWLFVAAGLAHLQRPRREILPSACALFAFLSVVLVWEWAGVQVVAEGYILFKQFTDDPIGMEYPWLPPVIVAVSLTVPLILGAAILVRALWRRFPLRRAFMRRLPRPGRLAWGRLPGDLRPPGDCHRRRGSQCAPGMEAAEGA